MVKYGMSTKLQYFQDVIATKGIDAALEVLNLGIAHRYTAIFRLDDLILTNTNLFDKLHEVRPEILARVPLADSFCQLVFREGALTTADSSTDPRLDGSPYQGVVVAYHGAAIRGRDGGLYGTLCHFDMKDLALADADFEDLQQAARVLPRYITS